MEGFDLYKLKLGNYLQPREQLRIYKAKLEKRAHNGES